MLDWFELALFIICGGYIALRLEDLTLRHRARRRDRQLRDWWRAYHRREQ